MINKVETRTPRDGRRQSLEELEEEEVPRRLGPMSGRTGRSFDYREGGRQQTKREKKQSMLGEGGRGGKVETGRARDAALQREGPRGCTSSSVRQGP